ncbi:MAG TPA: hypothetical protein VG943_02390 [Caulobacterales bacterium]|nr:hypothetical protein [Caulobacterales bacterium]
MTPPIPIRIVCTHDAAKLAEDMQRRLSAEQHAVEISCGRQSLRQIGDARTLREAVILIWSLDAPSSHYMLQWSSSIEPNRLIEIARGRTMKSRAHVIDFSAWEGERGGPAWRALEDRLRGITRATEPPKPPPRAAAMALAAISAVAVGDAVWLRVQDAHRPLAAPALAEEPTPLPTVMQTAGIGGEGGPLHAAEPASSSPEDVFRAYHGQRVRPLDAPRAGALATVADADAAPSLVFQESRPGVLDRLTALAAPVTHRDENGR